MLDDKNKLNNTEEPLDTIEKTVEDLRKKIQELSDEQDARKEQYSIPEFASEEVEKIEEIIKEDEEIVKEKTEDLKDNALKVMNDSFENVKSATNKVLQDKPELKKSVDFIKNNAMKAVDVAKDKYKDLAKNPKVAELSEKANDAMKDAANIASETAKSVSTAMKPLLDNAQEYIQKKEVQEKLDKVKETTVQVANTVKDSVLDFLNKSKD
ncbi:MAG: hypothetical protein IJ875_04530 [Solobacterium sp.]|nr:hypothetical protein [Solobacterium sp.]